MLKTFFAIFSLAVFLLIQTTESHHMFRWELSQMQSFQNCFFLNIFLRIQLWAQKCPSFIFNGRYPSRYTEFHHIECSLMEHLLSKLEAGFSEFQVSGDEFKMFAFDW